MPFTERGWERPGTGDRLSPPSDEEIRALPTSDLCRLTSTGSGLYALGTDEQRARVNHAEMVAATELDRRVPPWQGRDEIAAMVQGDGTDAQRIALADAIREGRSC